MRRDLAFAIAASVAVILGAPYVGQMRGRLQDALPGHYRTIVAAIVIGAAAAAVIAALARIRERRAVRYVSLAAAFIVAITYARATRTGNVDQDLVEQFHFVEYGLVTYLFYRVWRHRGGRASVVLPLCAGLVVGVVDEWFQWFIPSRVGELHDVFINAVAAACGVLFSVGVHPLPPAVPAAAERRAVALGIAAVVLAVSAFIHFVHLGYVITDPMAGTFKSQFNSDALRAAAADRAIRWRVEPPSTATGFAREDRYFAEGQWHVQRRNDLGGGDEAWRAWHENRILEMYFAPVLDLGARWSDEARAQAETRALTDAASYVSNAEPYPIYAIDKWVLWSVTVALLAAIWVFRG